MITGVASSIEAFITRLKTQKIDVDSTGKPCKEKMMSVICNKPMHSNQETKFEVLSVSDSQALNELFQTSLLMREIYKDFIEPSIKK